MRHLFNLIQNGPYRHVLRAAMFLLAWSCAKQGFPPGGPADTTPPRILAVHPAPDSTRVPRTVRPAFTFSEKIDHKSLENAVFVSPQVGTAGAPEGELHLKWHGNRVEVIFPDSLRADRTYVVTIGTDVRDLRNNRMKDAFALAFSTGDSLDRGEISGRILEEKASGALIMAYILQPGRDPDPVKDPPDYYSQTGESGQFVLSYLAPGWYRVFALVDRDGDRLHARGEEPLGVPTRDVHLPSGFVRTRPLEFRLALADTLRPTLAAVTALSRNQLEWRFDEAVAPPDSLWPDQLHVISAAGDSVPLLLIAPHPLQDGLVLSVTAPLQGQGYRAFARGLQDAAGNVLDTLAAVAEFTGTAQPDTVRPRVVKISIADSARNLALDTAVEVFFSEIMRIPEGTTALVVKDSSGAPAPGASAWVNPLQLRWQPQPRGHSLMRYTLTILADSLRDWNGNVLFDTTGTLTFWTLDADTLASISGTVSDEDSTAQGPIHLFARQTGGKLEYRQQLPVPGPYLFPAVLPGLYLMRAFRDANSNGRLDPGSPFPFLPAERYTVWPDTIKVRSRWPNENNNFILPSHGQVLRQDHHGQNHF